MNPAQLRTAARALRRAARLIPYCDRFSWVDRKLRASKSRLVAEANDMRKAAEGIEGRKPLLRDLSDRDYLLRLGDRPSWYRERPAFLRLADGQGTPDDAEMLRKIAARPSMKMQRKRLLRLADAPG